MEGGWREEGGKMERGWREDGGKMEEEDGGKREEGWREEGGWRREEGVRREGEERRGGKQGKQGEKERRREMNKHLTGRRNTMTMYVFSNYWAVMHNDIIIREKHLGIVVRVLFLFNSDKHNHYLA